MQTEYFYLLSRKIRTSVSLRPECLEAIKRIAQREDRSVSKIIEHLVEEKIRVRRRRRKRSGKM